MQMHSVIDFPALGDFSTELRKLRSCPDNAFQTQVEHRFFPMALTFNVSYTYLDQKSTALDTGNSRPWWYHLQPISTEIATNGSRRLMCVHAIAWFAYGIYDLGPSGGGRPYGALDVPLGGCDCRRMADDPLTCFAKSGNGFLLLSGPAMTAVP